MTNLKVKKTHVKHNKNQTKLIRKYKKMEITTKLMFEKQNKTAIKK